MEVRGGCGYIEERPDARVLRDAHLGSIWEGTSNVVALDVLRAARRDGGLEALQAHMRGLAAPGLDVLPAMARAAGLAEATMAPGATHLTRQAASALYQVTSAAAMAWEAERLDDPARLVMAGMALQHRVLPRDPLRCRQAAREPGSPVAASGIPPAQGVDGQRPAAALDHGQAQPHPHQRVFHAAARPEPAQRHVHPEHRHPQQHGRRQRLWPSEHALMPCAIALPLAEALPPGAGPF